MSFIKNEILQRILFELIAIFFMYSENALIPLSQQIIYFLVTKKYQEQITVQLVNVFNATLFEDLNGTMLSVQMKNEINKESTFIIFYLNIANILPSTVVIFIFGIYSDFIKKRNFMMYLPCLGTLVLATCYIISLFLYNGNIDSVLTKIFLICGSIFAGLMGRRNGFFSGYSSFVSDTDTSDNRTSRFAIFGLIIGSTFAVSNLINALYLFYSVHYEYLLVLIIIISLFGFIISCFVLDEAVISNKLNSKHDSTSTTNENVEIITDDEINTINNNNLQKTEYTKIVTKNEEDLSNSKTKDKNKISFKNSSMLLNFLNFDLYTFKTIWAYWITYALFIFVQQGQERIYVQYLKREPLVWTDTNIGLFIFMTYLLSAIGCYPGIIFVGKIFNDLTICILSFLSKLASSLILAFCVRDFMIYIAGAVQIFHLIPIAVMRSTISKQAPKNKQGAVYAVLHSTQAVATFFGPLVHNAIFTETVTTFGGLAMIVSSVIILCSILMLLIYSCQNYMKKNDYENLEPVNLENKK